VSDFGLIDRLLLRGCPGANRQAGPLARTNLLHNRALAELQRAGQTKADPGSGCDGATTSLVKGRGLCLSAVVTLASGPSAMSVRASVFSRFPGTPPPSQAIR